MLNSMRRCAYCKRPWLFHQQWHPFEEPDSHSDKGTGSNSAPTTKSVPIPPPHPPSADIPGIAEDPIEAPIDSTPPTMESPSDQRELDPQQLAEHSSGAHSPAPPTTGFGSEVDIDLDWDRDEVAEAVERVSRTATASIAQTHKTKPAPETQSAPQTRTTASQPWSPKRKTAIVLQVIRGTTTPVELARKPDNPTAKEIQAWVDDFVGAGEEHLRLGPANREAMAELLETQRELHAKIGEQSLVIDALKRELKRLEKPRPDGSK